MECFDEAFADYIEEKYSEALLEDTLRNLAVEACEGEERLICVLGEYGAGMTTITEAIIEVMLNRDIEARVVVLEDNISTLIDTRDVEGIAVLGNTMNMLLNRVEECSGHIEPRKCLNLFEPHFEEDYKYVENNQSPTSSIKPTGDYNSKKCKNSYNRSRGFAL